tara:strand:- start:985 stop:1686 length:702 start_codon:yes stop_codon:yes gene_type:complete
MTINLSAMILAAGFGKRMLPLTKYKPKSLIDINGVTLLENSIFFLEKLGLKNIVINTHYQSNKIYKLINDKYSNKNIKIIYEKKILDTGGGIKNALPYFLNDSIIIINSDIFWTNLNVIDVNTLIENYKKNNIPSLLLVSKKSANGIYKKKGDFILQKNTIRRYKHGDDILFYAGLQILNKSNLNKFNQTFFSVNRVWDYLIAINQLTGSQMTTDWYHVGDIQGLKIVNQLEG